MKTNLHFTIFCYTSRLSSYVYVHISQATMIFQKGYQLFHKIGKQNKAIALKKTDINLQSINLKKKKNLKENELIPNQKPKHLQHKVCRLPRVFLSTHIFGCFRASLVSSGFVYPDSQLLLQGEFRELRRDTVQVVRQITHKKPVMKLKYFIRNSA